MKAGATWLLLLVASGCSSSHPLSDDSGSALGSSDTAGGLGGALGASDAADGLGAALGPSDRPADAGSASSLADCGPPMPTAPCRTDSDCRSAYLVCVPPDDVTIEICRDPDAGVDPEPACPSFPELSSAPICPHTQMVTSTICEVRYQRPCTVDADCGPLGFTCAGGQCQRRQIPTSCSSASDCPTEWDCYAACACPGIRDTKACEPPFVEFNCPECPSSPS